MKQAIAWALFILVPALAVTGLTGFRLAAAGAASPLLARKTRRMPVIAGNGIAILVPSAITLAILSGRGEFGASFVVVQAIELLAGAVNLALIASNIRDGMRLSGRIRRAALARS